LKHSMPLNPVSALPGRFNAVLEQAAELCEPELKFVDLPKRSLNSEADLKAHLSELEAAIRAALQDGPVRIRCAQVFREGS